MNEAQWLACDNPEDMLVHLDGSASNRKRRLFGVACCRRIWSLLPDERSRVAVETSEAYADRLVSRERLVHANAAAQEAALAWYPGGNDVPGSNAYAASAAVDVSTQYEPVVDTIGFITASAAGFAEAEDAAPHDADQIAEWATASEISDQVALLRDIFGNPFRPVAFDLAWRTDTAVSLARQMYEAREFGAMPILADALQDAGCDNDDVLDHCRDASATHVRGCWVVDLVLGKE